MVASATTATLLSFVLSLVSLLPPPRPAPPISDSTVPSTTLSTLISLRGAGGCRRKHQGGSDGSRETGAAVRVRAAVWVQAAWCYWWWWWWC